MKKDNKIIYLILFILLGSFFLFFIIENIYTLVIVHGHWQESTFLYKFMKSDFNFFSRIVKHLLIITSFYKIDFNAILSVIIYFFRAIGIAEALYLIFGLVLYYFYYIKDYEELKTADNLFAFSLLFFALKMLSASISLLYSQYLMTMTFDVAIQIIQITLYLITFLELLCLSWLIYKIVRIIKFRNSEHF